MFNILGCLKISSSSSSESGSKARKQSGLGKQHLFTGMSEMTTSVGRVPCGDFLHRHGTG